MTGQESAFSCFIENSLFIGRRCDNEGIADGSDVPWTYPQHTRELENPESTVPCPRLTRHPSLFNLFLAWLRPERPIPYPRFASLSVPPVSLDYARVRYRRRGFRRWS